MFLLVQGQTAEVRAAHLGALGSFVSSGSSGSLSS
jgi:hypothetical protein